MKIIVQFLVSAMLLLPDVSIAVRQNKLIGDFNDRVDVLLEAIKSRKIVCLRTKPDEVKAILGKPKDVDRDNDGIMEWYVLCYPDVEIRFSKFRIYRDDPLTLRSVVVRGTKLNIEGEGPAFLRNVNDLEKLSSLHDVSLRDLDLTNEGDILKHLDFDTTTMWPASDKLPPGFDPQKLLREGKNPGLGIRALHEKGIDGDGIGIAILDQRLLLGHEEYASNIIRYDATRASGLPPQFHASPIVGISVGKSCGVAPGAFVFYYALPRTDMPDNRVFCEIIQEIIRHNETSEDSDRIRVISISTGTFEDSANFDLWKATCKKGLEAGILIVTCSDRFLEYGTLKLKEGKDPDDPGNYVRNKYGRGNNVLQIPTGNKTIASYRGTNVYTYERGDGKSWAAPYIAGLAALAFQVNPDLEPRAVVEQLIQTVKHTKAGPVVNPSGFIKDIRVKRIVEIAKASSVDRSSPEATVRNWTKAVAKGDVEDAMACMLSDNFENILRAEPSSRWYPIKKMLLSIDTEKPIRILDRQLTVEEAEIEWEFTFKEDVKGDAAARVPSIKKDQGFKVNARLERLGDYWLIDTVEPARESGA